MVSWNDAPQLAPNGDYKLKCEDYIPAGSQGGAESVDIMVLNFADPKQADKYMPFRLFLNDQRTDCPEALTEDQWASILERNKQLKELVYEAFGFDKDKDEGREAEKLTGKDTGKDKLRVSQRNQSGTTVNTISLPRNPAPQGDYVLTVQAADYKERQELGMRKWLNITVAIDGKDAEGKEYTPIRGIDTMVKFAWSKDYMHRDEETKKGFKTERDYLGLVQQDAERAMRVCQAFGLPRPEQKEDTEILYLDWGQDLRSLLTPGTRSKKAIRLTQTLDQQSGERFNKPHWPAMAQKK